VSRAAFSLLALVAASAFAPAPFPRSVRRDDRISYRALQGKWRVVSAVRGGKDGQRATNKPFDGITIEGAACIFDRPFRYRTPYGEEDLASVPLVLDGTRRPVAIDLGIAGDETVLLARGIIRRKGDQLVIVLTFGGGDRADDFDQPPERHYLLTLQRQR
jgi:uncharacterized protein (TIGR03067 family)